jgi:hypothetical protein
MFVPARPTVMRRTLASLVVVLMTLALVTRAIAAPLLHLHEALEPTVPAAIVAQSEAEHADCAQDMDGAAADQQAAPAITHSHGADSPMTSHAKACDSNGACCGPLALNDASVPVLTSLPAPEPVALPLSAGVRPASPDRPPSPLLA